MVQKRYIKYWHVDTQPICHTHTCSRNRSVFRQAYILILRIWITFLICVLDHCHNRMIKTIVQPYLDKGDELEDDCIIVIQKPFPIRCYVLSINADYITQNDICYTSITKIYGEM